jgi:hypothetical protein
MGAFPGSKDSATEATIYGPLPDHGQTDVAVVLHTTETAGMPGYGEGSRAPHYTYSPRFRTFYKHAEPTDGYVGTLRGHTRGGHGNCKAIQLEIIAYSDWPASQIYSTGIFIGDLTDDNYEDLGRWVAWAKEQGGVGNSYTKEPPGGWLAGSGSQYRMTTSTWQHYSGLTVHGAVPLNTHWDTGVLDIERIHNAGGMHMYWSWANEMFDLFTNEEIQDLYDAGYIEGDEDEVVAYFARLRDIGALNRTQGQRKEIARLIQTSTVSGWLAAAN